MFLHSKNKASPMSINQFIEMTVFLRLIFFSISIIFIEIALSHSISEINTFLNFTQFKICKKSPVDSVDTMWENFFVEIALSRCF